MRCITAGALFAVSFYLAACIPAVGQPLVTGDLTVYYDFDDFEDVVPDKSGNELHGLVTFGYDGFDDDANFDDLPDIRWTDDAVRGAGSAWFDTDPVVKEDRIEICQLDDPDANSFCEDLDESLVPHAAFTVAAWVKVMETDPPEDQSVFQSRSFNGSFVTHAQLQGDGRLRIHLRGQEQFENIAGTRVYTDGTETNTDAAYPFEEWFHYAATYDQAANSYGLYYNGRRIAGGVPNGDVGNDAELGDWHQGAWIGLVPDFARQLVGKIDEFYLFTRALSASEIQELVDLEPPLPGDFNGDGALDLLDIDALTLDVSTGGSPAYDVNGDGKTDQDDREVWINELKWTYVGDANLDGEFNSADMVQVFVGGKYEADSAAGWGDGDWNGDLVFNSGDMVVAFIEGAYEKGKRPTPAGVAVPEPNSLLLLVIGALSGLLRRRRHPA